jgi:hypothetical protein
LAKLPLLLSEVKTSDISVADLYSKVKIRIDETSDFLDALDCLFALKEIELNEQSGELHYVDRNSMR